MEQYYNNSITTSTATIPSCNTLVWKTDTQILKEKTEEKFKEVENRLKKLEELNKNYTTTITTTNNVIKMNYCKELDINAPSITKVEVLNPGKVMRFTFSDNTVIKTVCTAEDVFDFKFAFFLAYAKYFWGSILTSRGIESKAQTYTETKFFNSLVKEGMKVYFNQKRQEEKEEKEKAERKEIKARQAAKKAIKKAKRRENKINIIAEAINKTKASN